MALFFKIVVLVGLVKLLPATEKPIVCSTIYALCGLGLSFMFAVPVPRALIGAGISWALATVYFWLLNRTGGVAFMLVMVGGLAIGLV